MNKKLLRKKLALMLATLKKKRPYYCEVEFLQNKAGADYINTGIYYDWSQNANVTTVFSVPTLNRRYVIAGSYSGIGLNLEVRTDGSCRMYGNNGSPDVHTTNTIQANEKVKIIFKRNYPETEMTVITPRWTETVSNTITHTGISATALYLFRDTRSTFGLPMIYKFYIKMGDIEKDFIPVLDWDYHPCMYEKNASEFYYDANPSDKYGFIAGRQIHKVDYLESTGTQYIDTGLDYFADFEVGIQLRTSVSNKALGNGAFCCMQRYNAANPYWYFTRGSGESNSYNSSTPITEHHVMKWKDNKIYSDDVLLTEFTKDSNTPNRMYLYSANTSIKYPNVIYFCKLWNPADGTLVRDYIPAIDENGVAYLFDRVSHTIYDNAGTGAFKYPAREVEYLTSDGNQYIDTGIQPTDDYGYKIRNTYTRGGGEQCAIGCMDNGNRFVGIYTSGSENQLSGAWGSFVGFLPTFAWATGDILDVEVNYKNSRKMIVNGTELKDISDIHVSGTVSNTIYLFARHYGSTITKMKGNVCGVEITNGQNVVADFIPAFKDGQIGMYDKVGGVLKTNIGTGSFTTGKIVEPEYE